MSSGPFQTGVNQLLGLTAGAVAGIRRFAQDEKQALEKERQEANAQQKEVAERGIEALRSEEVRDIASEQLAAKAYKKAQDRGLATPNRIMFDEDGSPLATYDELASIMADSSLSQNLSNRLRNSDAVKARREMLKKKKGANV